MSTRVRFTSFAPAYSPAFHATHWDDSVSAVRRHLDVDGANIAGAQTSIALAEVTASRRSTLIVQYVSKRLAAQTITGTLKGQMQCLESDAAMDAALQVHVRVVDPIAGTERGVLWAPDKTFTTMGAAGSQSYEMPTTKTNRKAPAGWSGSGHTLSSVAVTAGDVLVVEVGMRHCNTVSTSYTGTVYTGGDTASDLAEDETQTTTGTAWLEFSQTLLWHSASAKLDIVPTVVKVVRPAPVIPPGVGQVWPRGSRGV